MTRASAPAPAEPGLHPHVAARRAEPERDPVERAVAADLGALGAEDPAVLGQRLAADVAQPRVVADDQLGDDVEDAVDVVVRRTGTAPRPRPAAPSSSTISVRWLTQRPGPRLDRGQRDRLLDAPRRAARRRTRRRGRRRRCSATNTSSSRRRPRCEHELGASRGRVERRRRSRPSGSSPARLAASPQRSSASASARTGRRRARRRARSQRARCR